MTRERKGARSLGAAGICPGCSAEFAFRDLSPARSHRLTVPLYVAALVVEIAWVAILVGSGYMPRPRGAGGVVVIGAIYLGPALVIGAIASRLPRHRTATCPACGWTGKLTMPKGGGS